MKTVILNHTGCQPHLGCVAAMYVLERELERVCGEGCIQYRAPAHGAVIDGAVSAEACSPEGARRLADRLPYREWFEGCDRVILNGEGTLHWRHKRGNPRAWLWLALLECAAQAGCETWAVNTSLFSDSRPFLALAGAALRTATHVACRDRMTVRTLREAGVAQAVAAADLTLLVPTAIVPEVEASIAGRLSLEPGAGTRPLLMAGSSAVTPNSLLEWQSAFESLLRATEGAGVRWLLQPRWLHDRALAEQLAASSGALVVLDRVLAPAEAVWLVRQHRAVVSGRFHLNTCAVAAGVAALLLPGNTPKNEALAEHLDSPAYLSRTVAQVGRMDEWLQAPPPPGGTPRERGRARAARNFPWAAETLVALNEQVDSHEERRQLGFMSRCRDMEAAAFGGEAEERK